MWIFTTQGLASITVSTDDASKMQIRFRVPAEMRAIQKTYGIRGKIIETAGTDYPCRIITTRLQVIRFVTKVVAAIAYNNFKAANKAGESYGHTCHDVWRAGAEHQRRTIGYGPYEMAIDAITAAEHQHRAEWEAWERGEEWNQESAWLNNANTHKP